MEILPFAEPEPARESAPTSTLGSPLGSTLAAVPGVGPIEAAAIDAQVLTRAVQALEAGGLVGIPTETVYGLAARADSPVALERLAALKGRDRERALTWHVGERTALERFPRRSALAVRLVQRFWPGPLTLVLPGVPAGCERIARDDWTGVRLPGHTATARLLCACPFPVAATSANLSGESPLCEASDVAAAFSTTLELVLDGGPARLHQASVVLRLGRGQFELLRPGILDMGVLRDTAGLHIAFVCTGNTCRSPMAEGLARAKVARALEIEPRRLAEFGFAFRSMGVMAGFGAPASEHAVEVLARQEIDLTAHASSPAVPEDVLAADRVYALTQRHLEALRYLLPPGRARHCELLDPHGRDIPDPIGGPLAAYEETATRIAQAIDQRLPEWV